MNPFIENELRLHVMTHVHCVKTMLNQPVDLYMIKLQHVQFMTSFIDTKSIFNIFEFRQILVNLYNVL